MHKGHYGEYSGNAKHSRVTNSNMSATKKDDEAHMTYLKEDVDYDNKHGHSDEKMTADEKHISRLAGDLKYDKKHHGSPAKQTITPSTVKNMVSAASNTNPMREVAKLASDVNELKFKDNPDAFSEGLADKKRKKGKAIYGALTKEGKDIANEYLTGKRKITN